MKKVNVSSRTLKIGIRLFAASCALAFGNFILAALCLTFPGWNTVPGILATGLTDDEAAKQKQLLETIQSQVKNIIADSQKDNVSKSDLDKRIEALNKEVAKLSAEGMAELKQRVDKMAKDNETLQAELKQANDSLVAQGIELKKLSDNATVAPSQETISFRQGIKNAILEHKNTILEEKNDDYGKRLSMKGFFEKGNKTTPSMVIKVAVDMTEANIVNNNVSTVRLTELDPMRVGIPLTIYPHVMDVMQVKGITRPYMSLLVVYDYQDGAATKTEGSASGQSSFLFKTVEFKAFFIATHFILSDETLDDLEEALDEISIVAPSKILDKVDSKVLSAAGNDTTDIAGLFTANKHTAFSAPAAMAVLVDTPYIVDVIAAAKLQCETNKYKPNVVYLNPGDVALLAAAKNTMEDSKSDKRVQFDALGNPVAACGLRIIQNTNIPAGDLVVLDNMQTWIGRRKDMTMEIGYNGTDLTEGQKTVVLKVRVAFGVRDKAAVIYCNDIAAAITALTKPA